MNYLKRPQLMSAAMVAKHQAIQRFYQQAAASAQTTMALQASNQTHLGQLANNLFATQTLIASNTISVVCPTPTAASSQTTVGHPTWFPPTPLNGDSYVVADGRPYKFILPDGAVIDVDANGSFKITDKDAKITYRANRVRDFNSFINASDKLESFVKFCGEQGVRQSEMLEIPVKHFIAWLVVEAARADGEEMEAALPDLSHPRRCRCGRFLARRLVARKIAFCRPVCLQRELEAA